MAANLKSSKGIANLGKLVADQIWTTNQTPVAAFDSFRRTIHSSVYDKNLEDNVRPSGVPDDLIQPESDKYWGPDPETGIFGPTSNQNNGTGNGIEGHGNRDGTPPLQSESAWFRHTNIEDMEKPPGN